MIEIRQHDRVMHVGSYAAKAKETEINVNTKLKRIDLILTIPDLKPDAVMPQPTPAKKGSTTTIKVKPREKGLWLALMVGA